MTAALALAVLVGAVAAVLYPWSRERLAVLPHTSCRRIRRPSVPMVRTVQLAGRWLLSSGKVPQSAGAVAVLVPVLVLTSPRGKQWLTTARLRRGMRSYTSEDN